MPPQKVSQEILERVKQFLLQDKPDYRQISQLGPTDDVVAALGLILEEADVASASKAICVAGILNTPESKKMVSTAAESTDPSIRMSAAIAAKHLSKQQCKKILERLKEDSDPSVSDLAKIIIDELEQESTQGRAGAASQPAGAVAPSTAFPVSSEDESANGILLEDGLPLPRNMATIAPGRPLVGDFVAVASDEQAQAESAGRSISGDGDF